MGAINGGNKVARTLRSAVSFPGRLAAVLVEELAQSIAHVFRSRTIRRMERLREAMLANAPWGMDAVRDLAATHPELMRARFPRARRGRRPVPMRHTAQGRTPLMLAVINGKAEFINFLIPLSDLEAQDKMGETALTLSFAADGQPPFAALLAAGANVNHANKDGRTVLMHAARRGAAEIVKALLAASGCDANLTMGDGARSALSEAMEAASPACVDALRIASNQKIHDLACEEALRALGKFHHSDAFASALNGVASASAAVAVAERRRAVAWAMIDKIEPFLSAAQRAKAIEAAGADLRKKMPMASIRKEAADLLAEIDSAVAAKAPFPKEPHDNEGRDIGRDTGEKEISSGMARPRASMSRRL